MVLFGCSRELLDLLLIFGLSRIQTALGEFVLLLPTQLLQQILKQARREKSATLRALPQLL